MQKWIILIVVCIILVLGIVIVSNVSIETEYTPETEIEEVELRKTIVTLYFKDKESGELVKETQMIDSKELLKDPYGALIKLLLNGPQNSNYEKIIPENVTILDTNFENGCVTINFSKELENENIGQDIKEKIYTSINQTLRELKEVNSIRILIEGEEKEDYINMQLQNSNETTNSGNSINNQSIEDEVTTENIIE